MRLSKKEIAKIKKDYEESLSVLAEQWLSKNPITEPIEDYIKRTFIEAYTFGIGILDVVYGTQVASQIAIGNNNIQIVGQKIQKRVVYKGWGIYWNKEEEMYDLYTPEEMEQPAGFRDVEIELGSIDYAKAFIDKY